MKSAEDVRIIFVTAPEMDAARKVARALLEARLVACVNIVPTIESHYWWKDKLESGAECLLIIKTVKPKLPEVEQTVLANHPYDTPEIVSFPLGEGNERYLEWLVGEVGR